MRKSPIQLNSSKGAKWKASRSRSAHRQDASLGRNSNSILDTSNDTVKVNKSPVKLVKSQALPREPELHKSDSVGTYFTKTIRPTNHRTPFKTVHNPFTDSRGFKSFYEIPKSQGIVIQSQMRIPSQQREKKNFSPSMLDQSKSMHSKSPIQSIQQNERKVTKLVELGRPRQPIKIIHSPPIRVISSPPKVITQIVYKPTQRQIQLQRKVKILQIRIVELHNEKSQIETKLNDMNIRLQYENNFLKEKLNAVPEMKNNQQKLLSNIDHLGKSASSNQVKDNYDDNEVRDLYVAGSEKGLILDTPAKPPQHKFSKSSDGFFQKSKQIQTIKQQLLQTEQMLSKQIDKSLKLLEELSLKQKQNQQLKNQMKLLKQKIDDKKDTKILELQSQNKHLFQKLQSLQTKCSSINGELSSKMAYITQLEGRIIELSSQHQPQGDKVPTQMFHQIEQNNQLLLSAITSLQNSVNESQKQIEQLTNEKVILQDRIMQLQSELQEKRNKLQEKDSGNEALQEKMDETENEIRVSRNKVETFELLIQEKNELIGEKEKELLQKQLVIQNLQQRVQQLEITNGTSPTQSGCRLAQRTTCTKCGQLRRTVIRLNSYLNNNSNEFSREAAKAAN